METVKEEVHKEKGIVEDFCPLKPSLSRGLSPASTSMDPNTIPAIRVVMESLGQYGISIESECFLVQSRNAILVFETKYSTIQLIVYYTINDSMGEHMLEMFKQEKQETINLNTKFVDECINYRQALDIIKGVEKTLCYSKPEFRSDKKKSNDLFEEGLLSLRGGKMFEECREISDTRSRGGGYYEKAISQFEECAKLETDKKSLAYYNIACSYAHLLNTSEVIKWLNKAIDAGYTDWSHTISDTDFKDILTDKDYVACVKRMIAIDPSRKNIYVNVNDTVNLVDVWLYKHGCNLGYTLTDKQLAYIAKHDLGDPFNT